MKPDGTTGGIVVGLLDGEVVMQIYDPGADHVTTIAMEAGEARELADQLVEKANRIQRKNMS